MDNTNGQNMPGDLTMEQQFKLKVIQDQVKTLDLEQCQQYVCEVIRQKMVKDNLVKHLLKNA